MIITKFCTGCGLCSEICPQACIKMVNNYEGFISPVVDEFKCVKCKLCIEKCPQNNNIKKSESSDYYAAANSNETDLSESSSGGMFILFAKEVLLLGGMVSGCIYDENMKCIHTITDDIQIVKKMCGSKYVQSEAFSSYKMIKACLNNGRIVLFSGTGCQVAALKVFLGKDYPKLITVDILCHGVPSNVLFRKYIDYLEKKRRLKVVDVSFRCKDMFGWGSEHRTRVTFLYKGKLLHEFPYMPAYFCAFFYGINLMESCYRCKYAGRERISDITIGDFWGYYEKFHRRFPKGISIILTNNNKGKMFVDRCEHKMSFFKKLTEAEGKGTNTNLYHPTYRYKSRADFYKDLYNKSYTDISVKIYTNKEIRKKLIKSFMGAAKCRFGALLTRR